MTEERLTHLEIKFMEQEQLLSELNKIVSEQQSTIENLLKEIKTNNERSNGVSDESVSLFDQLQEERPPHY